MSFPHSTSENSEEASLSQTSIMLLLQEASKLVSHPVTEGLSATHHPNVMSQVSLSRGFFTVQESVRDSSRQSISSSSSSSAWETMSLINQQCERLLQGKTERHTSQQYLHDAHWNMHKYQVSQMNTHQDHQDPQKSTNQDRQRATHQYHQDPQKFTNQYHQDPHSDPQQDPQRATYQYHQDPQKSTHQHHQNPQRETEQYYQDPERDAHQNPEQSTNQYHQDPQRDAHQNPEQSTNQYHQDPQRDAHQNPEQSTNQYHQNPQNTTHKYHQDPQRDTNQYHQDPQKLTNQYHQDPQKATHQYHQGPQREPQQDQQRDPAQNLQSIQRDSLEYLQDPPLDTCTQVVYLQNWRSDLNNNIPESMSVEHDSGAGNDCLCARDSVQQQSGLHRTCMVGLEYVNAPGGLECFCTHKCGNAKNIVQSLTIPQCVDVLKCKNPQNTSVCLRGGLVVKRLGRKQLRPSRSPECMFTHSQGVIFSMTPELLPGGERSRLSITHSCSAFSRRLRKHRSRSEQITSSEEETQSRLSHQYILNNPVCLECSGRSKVCASCCTRKTPLWRDAEDGTPLCNACGIRYKKYRVRCLQCWNIPRKEENMHSHCLKCGDALKSKSSACMLQKLHQSPVTHPSPGSPPSHSSGV